MKAYLDNLRNLSVVLATAAELAEKTHFIVLHDLLVSEKHAVDREIASMSLVMADMHPTPIPVRKSAT